jgi:hypothetical protein
MKLEFIKYLSIPFTILFAISTLTKAQETNPNERLTMGMTCGNQISQKPLYNFKIDIIDFIPVDPSSLDVIPTIIGGSRFFNKKNSFA